MSFRDDWPKMPLDDSNFDSKQLHTLVRNGNSPFHGVWHINLLIREIEENLGAEVIDIPVILRALIIPTQSFHLKLSNRLDIIARLARSDDNMPNSNGFPIQLQVPEVKFEVAVYDLLRSEPNILASRLLYYHIPVQHISPRFDPFQDAGRRLFLFEEQKERIMYSGISVQNKNCVPMLAICSAQLNLTVQIFVRPAFLLRQPVFAHYCSTSIFCSTSLLLGFANALLNRNLNRFLFPLLLHDSSALLFLRPRLKQQSRI
ncbi:hypothetical protein B0O99DRAFT_379572 [Bisporella sp. PMI_857]|nr:hypothetical protein B0O99DRAFT_379572 [Bisporella sp. PMI_857]